MSNRLRAIVQQATGNTKHTLGVLGRFGPEVESEFPIAVTVMIDAQGEEVLLLRFDRGGEFCGDTWHQSINEAKEQARFEFGISLSDWNETTEISSDASP